MARKVDAGDIGGLAARVATCQRIVDGTQTGSSGLADDLAKLATEAKALAAHAAELAKMAAG